MPDSVAISDPRLVDLISRGDEQALAALYERYAPLMLGVALTRFSNRGEAEDLVHDLFIEVWHKAASYRAERGSVRTWLLLRLNSRALDRVRAPRLSRCAAEPPRDGLLVGYLDETGPDQAWVRSGLDALPERERSVLELAYFRGLSTREIAAHESLPQGTVKSRLASGLRRLRLRAEGQGAPL